MNELIVIPPTYFDVVDTYNTRMRPDHPHGRPDRMRTMAQWSRMIGVLNLQMDIESHWLLARPGLADMAFACDPGLWIDDLFIASNFWPPAGRTASPRQAEVETFTDWFGQKGVRIATLPSDAYFEGGDCVMVGKSLVIGYGENRTNIRGVEEITKLLEPRGIEVIPIRRITEEFYHLNSVFTYFPSADLIAFYPPAFSADAFNTLSVRLPLNTRILEVTESEAMRHHPDFGGEYLYSYTLNAIERNGMVLMPYCAPSFGKILEHHGLKVIVPPDGSSEFERSGGSYRCLTMFHNVTR
ncbi:MAG: hypothetical protein Q8Q39_00315 [bacterium]|nr:hypothetical protein [bacterium]